MIGNRFGSIVPIAPGVNAPSAIYNLFDQYYSKVDGGWVLPDEGITATGGVISDYEVRTWYRSHIFTHTDTLTVTDTGNLPTSASFLAVGGGGGGGNQNGPGHGGNGGGGGGGYVEGTTADNISRILYNYNWC